MIETTPPARTDPAESVFGTSTEVTAIAGRESVESACRQVSGWLIGSGMSWARLCVAGALLVGAVMRILWLMWLPMPPESDFATFLSMAHTMADGTWQPDAYGWVYQGPGYPMLLAPLLAFGANVDVLRGANVVAQMGMLIAIWKAADNLFGGRGAAVAIWCAALMPGLWSYVPLLAAESVAMLLVSVVAMLLTRSITPGRAALLGVIVSYLAIARPSFLPFVPVLALMMLGLGPGRMKRLSWFVVGVTLVAGPVLALNVANDGSALPVGAAGWQVWLVNNEHATGSWFDVSANGAYPFAGLATDAETRGAQSKLGLQFVAANPDVALSTMLDRHQLNWQTDVMGISWTLDRAPASWQAAVPFRSATGDIAQLAYVAVLGMATIACVRHRQRETLLLPVTLPLLYGIGMLAVAEGNARYHAVFLPLLCVLAGGAGVLSEHGAAANVLAKRIPDRLLRISSTGRHPTQRRASGAAGIAVIGVGLWLLQEAWLHDWWQEASLGLAPLLIVAVVLVPLLGGLVGIVSRRWAVWMQVPVQPSWRARLVLALTLLGVVGGAWQAYEFRDRQLGALAAVSPAGWERTVRGKDETSSELPLLLQDSETPPGMRKVSYPDSALLGFDHIPQVGDIVTLTRTLDDLQPGNHYVFYLQVYDPAAEGDLSERLSITLNGDTVWERQPGRGETGAWNYVRVEWIAQATTVEISVARVAGTDYQPSDDAVPLVRTLHLYPDY